MGDFFKSPNLTSTENQYNSTKSGNIILTYILKAFFARHSSEYKTSDSDRKVNRNIYPDAVTRDRTSLIDTKSGQLGPMESINTSYHV